MTDLLSQLRELADDFDLRSEHAWDEAEHGECDAYKAAASAVRALLPDQPEPVADQPVEERARRLEGGISSAAAELNVVLNDSATLKAMPYWVRGKLELAARFLDSAFFSNQPIPSQPLAEQPQRCPSCESDRPEADLYWDIGTADWETCTDPFHQEPPTNV